MKLIFISIVLLLLTSNIIYPAIYITLHNTRTNTAYRRIMKQVNEFEKIDSLYATIYYTKEDYNYIALIKRTVDFYYPVMSKDFDLDANEKITIVIYPNAHILSNTLKTNNSNFPIGAYHGGILNIASPKLWAGTQELDIKKRFLSEGPIIHELAHLLLDRKTNGNFPVWFTEGVALYYEYKYTGFVWREDLKEQATKLSIECLENDWNTLDTAIAYRKSFDIINDFVTRRGESELQNIINNLRIDFFNVK